MGTKAASAASQGALPVHPAAEMLPLMGAAEIRALADDIEANGLQHPIIIWEDNTAEADGGKGPFPRYLLDGRNRMEALKLLGIADPMQAMSGRIYADKVRVVQAIARTALFGSAGLSKSGWKVSVDPTTFVLSMNVKRRHLTSEQKREAIKAYLAAAPTVKDREVARALGVSPTTVAEVRKDSGVQNGQRKRAGSPAERARTALLADPALATMPLSVAAKTAGVRADTFSNVRKELASAGEIPTVTLVKDAPKPAPKKKPAKQQPTAAERKAEQVTKAINEIATLVADLAKAIKVLEKLSFTEEQHTIIKAQATAMRDIMASLRAVGGN